MLIRHGDRLFGVDHIAVAEIGPLNTRGFRPVKLLDDGGRELGMLRHDRLTTLPNSFVRICDRLINLAAAEGHPAAVMDMWSTPAPSSTPFVRRRCSDGHRPARRLLHRS